MTWTMRMYAEYEVLEARMMLRQAQQRLALARLGPDYSPRYSLWDRAVKTALTRLWDAQQNLEFVNNRAVLHEAEAYNRDLILRIRDGQLGSGMKHR
jgi:hypothetical protein